ncbi:unnamed protein product [Closterium sp. NIES-65]|nr:unnamed protein product [Closterium sp. NIES-65]
MSSSPTHMLDTSPFPSLPPLPPLPHLLSLLFLLFLLFLFFLLFSPLLSSALPPIPFLLTACPPVLKGPMSRGMLHVLAQAGTAAQRREECPMCWRKLALQDETWYVQDETWYVQDETWYVQDETWHGQDETWSCCWRATGREGEKGAADNQHASTHCQSLLSIVFLPDSHALQSGAAAGVLQGEKERKVQPTTSTPPLIANLSSLLSFFLTLMRCSQELLLACYREKEIQAAEQRAAAAAAAAAIAASVRGAVGRGTAARGVAARGVAVRGHVRRGAQPMGTGGSSSSPSSIPAPSRHRQQQQREQREQRQSSSQVCVWVDVKVIRWALSKTSGNKGRGAHEDMGGSAHEDMGGSAHEDMGGLSPRGYGGAQPMGTGRSSSIPAPLRHRQQELSRTVVLHPCSLPPSPAAAAAAAAAAAGAEGAAAGQQSGMFVFESTQEQRQGSSQVCLFVMRVGSPPLGTVTSEATFESNFEVNFESTFEVNFESTFEVNFEATVTSGSPVDRWLPSSLHSFQPLTTMLTLPYPSSSCPVLSPFIPLPLRATVTSGSPVDRSLPSSLLSSLRLTPIFILFVPTRLNPLRATVTSGSPVERWLPSSLCHATSSLSVPVQTTLLTLLPLDSPSSPLQATVTSGSPVDRWLPSSLLSSLRHATSSSSSSRGISGSSPRSFALSFSPHRHRSSRSASPSSSTIPATNTTTTTTITTSSSSSSSSSASLSAALASSSSPSASASAPSASLPTTATSLAATATLSDTTSAAVAAGTPANSASSAAAATSDAGAAPACPFTSPPIACYRADPSVLAAEAACSPPTFSLSPLRPRPPSALSFYPPETSSSGETNRGFSLSAGALPLDTPLGATVSWNGVLPINSSGSDTGETPPQNRSGVFYTESILAPTPPHNIPPPHPSTAAAAAAAASVAHTASSPSESSSLVAALAPMTLWRIVPRLSLGAASPTPSSRPSKPALPCGTSPSLSPPTSTLSVFPISVLPPASLPHAILSSLKSCLTSQYFSSLPLRFFPSSHLHFPSAILSSPLSNPASPLSARPSLPSHFQLFSSSPSRFRLPLFPTPSSPSSTHALPLGTEVPLHPSHPITLRSPIPLPLVSAHIPGGPKGSFLLLALLVCIPVCFKAHRWSKGSSSSSSVHRPSPLHWGLF